jgi:hypothetical protein
MFQLLAAGNRLHDGLRHDPFGVAVIEFARRHQPRRLDRPNGPGGTGELLEAPHGFIVGHRRAGGQLDPLFVQRQRCECALHVFAHARDRVVEFAVRVWNAEPRASTFHLLHQFRERVPSLFSQGLSDNFFVNSRASRRSRGSNS